MISIVFESIQDKRKLALLGLGAGGVGAAGIGIAKLVKRATDIKDAGKGYTEKVKDVVEQ